MFSFRKTLFPYLKQARDYQAKQPSWASCECALAYIYILKIAYALQHMYSAGVRGHFWGVKQCCRQTQKQQCLQLTTVIHRHLFTHFSPSISPCYSLSLPLIFQVNACL